MTEERRPRGRPSVYTQEAADEICERLKAGESLKQICKDAHLPGDSTVRGWYVDDTQGFSAQYTRARDLALDKMAEDVIDISDEKTDDPARQRLRFDARRWYLSKLAHKRYGDKLEVTAEVNVNVNVAEKMDERIRRLSDIKVIDVVPIAKTGS